MVISHNYGSDTCLVSELLVSRVTVTGLLSAVQEKLTHLDWTSASVSTELDRVARAVEKYFSQKVHYEA